MFEGMSDHAILFIFALIILAVSMAGACIPSLKKMDPRQVHLMVALSAGIFLGILFFTLLPETFEAGEDSGMNAAPWIVGGFLVVLLVDVILKRRHMDACACEKCDNNHGHELTSASAFIGLAIHAAVDGVVISIALGAGELVGIAAFIAIALHKFVELFALSSTFMLTGLGKKDILIYMLLFALITPVAALVSMPLVDIISDVSIVIPMAVAAGTFMYVGVYALLREAFHERRDSIISFALVVTGIVIIAVISLLLGGDAHGHP
ncbi:MAG: ZIP family metal transporter [Methanomassiliicoccaceae archaeon]|nr:ZIP family metal transporter [Methanomassiliicoccaceae archaeon]